jgi:hypothetical protein
MLMDVGLAVFGNPNNFKGVINKMSRSRQDGALFLGSRNCPLTTVVSQFQGQTIGTGGIDSFDTFAPR